LNVVPPALSASHVDVSELEDKLTELDNIYCTDTGVLAKKQGTRCPDA
jgi:hypothetical protein